MSEYSKKKIQSHVNQIITKVIQNWNKVSAKPEKTAKRVLWELCQNAKDSAYKGEKVDIEIELKDDSLFFRHNGAFFEQEHLLGLSERVSMKDSESDDENERKTGQFGTGFISTHLLSHNIEVNGIVINEDVYRKFTLHLSISEDRDELKKMLSATCAECDEICTNVIGTPVDCHNLDKKAMNTEFVYLFNDGTKGKEYAKDAISDLRETIAVTLGCVEKINSVSIIQDGKKETYHVCESTPDRVVVDCEKTKRMFFRKSEGAIQLLMEYQDVCGEKVLIKIQDSVPKLLIDFPLIGSEGFHFPYYINCWKFVPTEPRDGILLTGDEDHKSSTDNRKLFEKIIAMSLDFNLYLIQQGVKNLHYLLCSKLPVSTEPWNGYSKKWICNLQSDRRNELKKQNLLKAKNGLMTNLESMKVPDCSRKNLSLFNDILSLYKSAGELAGNEMLDDLNVILNEDKYSWNCECLYSLDDLLKDVAAFESIDKIEESLASNSISGVDFLNSVFTLLKEEDSLDRVKKYNVLPNQNNVLCKQEYIKHLESKDDPIPDWLKDLVYESELLSKNDYRSVILHNDCVIEINLPTIERADVLKKIDDIMGEYKGDFQEDRFSKIVFALQSKLSEEDIKKHMSHFSHNKNKWIAAAVTDGKKIAYFAKLATDDRAFEESKKIHEEILSHGVSADFVIQLLNSLSSFDVSSGVPENEDFTYKIGRIGEELAVEKLRKMGFSYVEWLNEKGESFCNYDIKAKKDNKDWYFDVKSTVTASDDKRRIPFYVSSEEWTNASNISNNVEYYLIRVFDVLNVPSFKFLKGNVAENRE